MAGDRQIISVGIDIGTTTTQVIFSRLSVMEIARPGQIPRIDIANREIIYTSDINFTPLIDDSTIDAARTSALLESEFRQAGIQPQQVETGAVIITGETARKQNADQVLNAISQLAGEFVVTIAGPNLEGMIAGRGSGAAAYSRKHFTTVINLDIGGGSANCAVFRQGEYIASSAMRFGGRVIEMDNGRITQINRVGQMLIEECGLRLYPGDKPDLNQLKAITDRMAELANHLAAGSTNFHAEKYYQTPPIQPVSKNHCLMLSGGIGYYFYDPLNIRNVVDINLHGDIGPLLAESLRMNVGLMDHQIIRPSETQRATVLGASSQTVTLSGSTIWADSSILPLKNIPIVRVELPEFSADNPQETGGQIQRELKLAAQRWDLQSNLVNFALSLDFDQALDYDQMVLLSTKMAEFMQNLPATLPLIVVTRRDYARVIGQTIKNLVGSRPILIIDQVGLSEGDYIDIGIPLMDGRVVPLVVKTLVFSH